MHMPQVAASKKENVPTSLIDTFKERNIEVMLIKGREGALEKIKELIPAGASVMNGTSRTLEEIGYIDYLKSGKHSWRNLHEEILKESDPAKQARLRKEASIADYYLGSVHALTGEGEFLIASASGSQLPGVVFNASNLIFVVGKQKIVPDLAAAFKRLKEYVVPLEDARMKKAHGIGTLHSKTLLFHREAPFTGRKVYLLLVDEELGF